MFLKGLATAVPPHRYTQRECWEALQGSPQFLQLSPDARLLLRTLLARNGGAVLTRHLAIPNLADAVQLTPDALHARFAAHAPVLASQAAERALSEARITPQQVDAVLVRTCTGYLCPGLTSYVSGNLGLRDDVHALDLVGQGCGAALPNFQTAQALLATGGARHVLSICVEVCSAAFYLDNDPGVLISASLFGDGAAAAVLSGAPAAHARRVEWKAAGTLLCPAERDQLRFETRGGMLRNLLSREVPALAATHARAVLAQVLERAALTPGDITGWILHPGGRQVLAAMQERLCLGETDVALSAAVLREFGNLSSPAVLFVLKRALEESTPGGWWWLSSFGAGFSCHGAVLRVD